MSIRFLCTACNTSIKAKDEYLGKTVRCPHCREKTVVPHDDQLKDVLEVDDEYGLAAMSAAEIEIDSLEMNIASPRNKLPATPHPDIRTPPHLGSIDGPSTSPVERSEQYLLLERASFGLRAIASCTAIVWLYILGGEFIELTWNQDAKQANQAFQSPLIHLSLTFIVGATTVCLLVSASEVLRVLLDIRNTLARTPRR